MKATLAQVVDPTVGGKKFCLGEEVSKGQLNSYKGLLEWKKRFEKVIVPTVYFKQDWVHRQLEEKELVNVLDAPGSRTTDMDTTSKKLLFNLKIPGKIFNCVYRGFSFNNESTNQPEINTYEQLQQDKKVEHYFKYR